MLGRLFRGPLGAEALSDMAAEYDRLAGRRGLLFAAAWYASHLLLPATWRLARALRGIERRTALDSPAGVTGAPSRSALLRYLPAVSWIDVKLGLRMLVKYPGLTIVSGLAMAVTIAVAIGTFSLFQDFLLRPVVPLDEGERIVSVGMLRGERQLTHRQLLHDFAGWKEGIESIEDLSIWRSHYANVVGPDGAGEMMAFAMMSASGFEVARVPPQLGRTLLEADEQPGAARVVVIGHRDWTERFRSDPHVIGQSMLIGGESHTVVGVMPEDYGFPVSAQRWLPFTDDPDDYAVMETPYSYYAFGRLADGVTMESAQAELTGLNSVRASELPDTHEHIRSLVMTYTDTHTGMDNAGGLFVVRIMMAVLTLLVLVPFVNVAILIYARTATRVGELTIRNALGAGRGRIVAQLFVEAFVLASLSALAGVTIVVVAFDYIDTVMAGIGTAAGLPFWMSRARDPWVAAYVVGLTCLAALVAGVIPGLKATRGGVQARLGRSAGGNGLRLGGAWTALVVFQVATTVALLPFAASMGWQLMGLGLTRPSFEAERLVAGYLADADGAVSIAAELDALGDPEERAAARTRAQLAIEEVVRQLEADERVAAVTHSSEIPGTLFGGSRLFEVEGVSAPTDRPAHRIGGLMAVAPGFFDVIEVVPSSGRAFDGLDSETAAPPIVVNQAFVDQVLLGANPLGRSIRAYREGDGDPAPWQEIVGVVDNLVVNPTHPERVESRMYTPLDMSTIGQGAVLVVRTTGAAQSYVPELRKIVTGVDPALTLGLVTQLGDLGGVMNSMIAAGSVAFAIVVVSGLLLCAAGVFSLMSFSVTQRRREIGVRAALGALPGQVLRRVLGRSLKQVGVGVLAGLAIVWVVPEINADGIIISASAGPTAFVTVFMVIVGLLAAVGPARQGLRIQPTEAMRDG